MTKSAVTRRQLREFGLLIGLVVPVFFGWLIPSMHGQSFRLWTLAIALPSLAFATLAPGFLAFPYQAWMALGHALGWINGHLILGAIFVLVLQPIAFLMRFTGYDPLRKRRIGSVHSYREDAQRDRSFDLTRIF